MRTFIETRHQLIRDSIHRGCLAALAGALLLGVPEALWAQGPLGAIPGLTEVAVYESTSRVNRVPFQPAGSELLSRRELVLNGSNRDFSFALDEYYDVFYSDAQGAPDPQGAFLTIEATWYGSATDGSMNITGAELVVSGQRVLATTVIGVRLGGRCVSGPACTASSASLAVDGDLSFNTIPRLGATDPANAADRIRLTLGFPRQASARLRLNPVSPVTRGGTLALSWNNGVPGPYTVGVTAGPNIGAAMALGTFICCSASFPIPNTIAPGTYRVVVAAGADVSPELEVVIQGEAPPVLAPIAPAPPGGILFVTWTPNESVLYDLIQLSGPGLVKQALVHTRAVCCTLTLPVPIDMAPGTYTVAIRGGGINGVLSAPQQVQILGSSNFELRASATILRPGLQTTLSWTDRGQQNYQLFAGPRGAAALAPVMTATCCAVTVPWNAAAPGEYDVYVQYGSGVRSNRVTVRIDP